MLRWCYILLISELYRFQARSIFDESCTAKPPVVIPEHCILKCVQLLYDNKFCSICEDDTEAPVDKRKLKWCSACETDQWQIDSTNYDLHRYLAKFFNALEIGWCNDALNLNEHSDKNELHRTKRYNPGIGGSHAHPERPSYSMINFNETNLVMGMIIFGIFLVCALALFCKMFAKSLDPQESYQVNS